MRNSKKYIWIGLFLALTICINLLLNYVLLPYSYVRCDTHHLTEGGYQDIYVGTSHGFAGIDPLQTDAITGRKSTNLCLGGEYLCDSYFLTKEAHRHNPLRRVIYVLDPGYWVTEPSQDSSYNTLCQSLPWSKVKLEYTAAKMLKADFRTTLFPWYNYRKDLLKPDVIQHNLTTKQSQEYKDYSIKPFDSTGQTYTEQGFMNIHRVENAQKTEQNLKLWNEADLIPKEFKYFNKLKSYCAQNQIDFVVVTLPVPKETLGKYQEQFDAAHNYFTQMMQAQNVTYCDFNYVDLSSQGFETTVSNYNDYDGHMYGNTAQKFSQILGEYLNAQDLAMS